MKKYSRHKYRYEPQVQRINWRQKYEARHGSALRAIHPFDALAVLANTGTALAELSSA